MHFHYCGNPVHDIIANTLALLSVLPDWIPVVRSVGSWAKAKLGRRSTAESA